MPMLTAEQQTHNYIIIRMTKTIYKRSAFLEKIIGAIIYIIWIFLHDKYKLLRDYMSNVPIP